MQRRKIIGVRLNGAEETILEDFCKEFSCKKSLVVRKAVEEYINKIRLSKKAE